jgi:excisionase family DNA binding protein
MRKESGEVQTLPGDFKESSKERVVTDDRSMDNSDRLLSVDELADYLGVPAKTLYAWRYRREGPRGFRVGRHLRYRWSDVQLWIEERLNVTHVR